jgi:long-chain acyl-CoA synthetase
MFASNFAQTTLRLGGLLVVMPRFDAAEFLRLVARHGITNAQVVPTMFVRLLRLPPDERARHDISTLRHVLHTGAPCPPKVKHDMIDWFGPVTWEQYGSTETGVVALCDTAEWLAHPGTVGRPFVSSEIRIYSKSGAPCPPGTPGEIYARMHGTPDFTYLGRPEARAEVEREGLISARTALAAYKVPRDRHHVVVHRRGGGELRDLGRARADRAGREPGRPVLARPRPP